jgi:endogenous inhibitor of DNA gyrase (YacG/DUF329 family)
MEQQLRHPCPACGYYVFSELDAQDEICPICSWQNDLVDLETMYEAMGPNKVSLEEAQQSFAKRGAVEDRFVTKVRPPMRNDLRDSKWRPLDRNKDTPRKINADSKKLADLYYWYWN